MPWFPDIETPYQGDLPLTKSCSRQGAIAGLPKAGSQAATVLALLEVEPRTLHELVSLTGYPLNVICARVGWLKKKDLIRVVGKKIGPFAVENSLYQAS